MPYIPGIAEQQIDQGAFLWTLRERAVHGRQLTLENIAAIDLRLDCHLDGLRLAGPEVWNLCREPLEHLSRGEAFLAMAVAIRLGDPALVAQCLEIVTTHDDVTAELASAVAWGGAEQARPWLRMLAESGRPTDRRVAIAAGASVRMLPELEPSLADQDEQVRARAARAAGELGRMDLHARLVERLADAHAVAQWAAWSLELLGGHEPARRLLQQAVESNQAVSPWIVQTLGLRMGPVHAESWLSGLNGRAGVLARVAVGEIDAVPWLLDQLEDPTLGSLAADAFCAITGADERIRLQATDDEHPLPIPEEGRLTQESCAALRAWWIGNQKRLPRGVRVLAGREYDREWALELLGTAPQGTRSVAALSLQMEEPRHGLFPLLAPGFQQQSLVHRAR